MALPEVITHQDTLLTVDSNSTPFLQGLLHPGLQVYPLFLDPYNGVWVLRAKFAPGITLPLHFHTGTVQAYTIKGRWYYTEYPDQMQTAGMYLFEPGGSVHQFNTPADNTEETEVFMVVQGSNVNFGADGEFLGIMDAALIKQWVDGAIAQQGIDGMRYIAAPIPGFTGS